MRKKIARKGRSFFCVRQEKISLFSVQKRGEKPYNVEMIDRKNQEVSKHGMIAMTQKKQGFCLVSI
jgi:hypothetical protein